MKRTEPKVLSTIIDEALRECNLDVAAAEHKAEFVWAEVMGQGINRYTSRRYVKDGIMHVYMTSAPLKNELSFHKSRIIEAINQAVGSEAIKSIIFH